MNPTSYQLLHPAKNTFKAGPATPALMPKQRTGTVPILKALQAGSKSDYAIRRHRSTRLVPGINASHKAVFVPTNRETNHIAELTRNNIDEANISTGFTGAAQVVKKLSQRRRCTAKHTAANAAMRNYLRSGRALLQQTSGCAIRIALHPPLPSGAPRPELGENSPRFSPLGTRKAPGIPWASLISRLSCPPARDARHGPPAESRRSACARTSRPR